MQWSENLVLERVISVAEKISRRSHDEPLVDAVLARGRGVRFVLRVSVLLGVAHDSHIIDAERTIYMGTLNARTFRRCFFSEVVQVPSCWGLWTGRVRPVTPSAMLNKGNLRSEKL